MSSYTRPQEWSSEVTEAIQQWRDLAGDRPRSHHRPQRDRRGGEPQSDPPVSPAGSSGSEDYTPSNKSLDVMAHLKYLVRGFLRQSRKTSTARSDRRGVPTNKECFVPSPMITFLIDEPDDLVCQVCQQTPLKLAITAESPNPGLTSILPCGHIFCHGCIDHWLASHDSCPFCRTVLTHADCKHQVQPRFIAQDTIHTLPPTLANGGAIGDLCFKCAAKDRREISLERWADSAKKFKAARQEAEELGTDEAIENMRKAQKAFERIPEDDLWVLLRRRHRHW